MKFLNLFIFLRLNSALAIAGPKAPYERRNLYFETVDALRDL